MSKNIIKPWKEVCELRTEILTKALTTSDFAVDLYRVIHEKGPNRPHYCDPEQFFSTTYATPNLRRFCRDVLRRLDGKDGGEPVINVAQTFGGGKSHTLTTLYYLTTLGKKLPKKQTSIDQILAESHLTTPPQAVVAAVSFDKVDWNAGGEVLSPEGKLGKFRMPWNLIAWQLLGQRGLDILERDESKPNYDTPPADTLWSKILKEVEAGGKGALILVDEFLMWAHEAVTPDASGTTAERGSFWNERLKNFFQRLSQAVEASDRSCLVVSLLASDPTRTDKTGRDLMDACNQGLNRLASVQSPVEKGDLAELLRRRMFSKFPVNRADRETHIIAIWERMKAIDPARAKFPDSDKRMSEDYPFHPDLLSRFFGKWADLSQFQRTRGVLQTFAMALREAHSWDESPIIGPQVFLAAPGKIDLSPALTKLAEVAKDSQPEKNPPWRNNMEIELQRVAETEKAHAPTLTARELQAACVASFIYSQPIGEQAELTDIRWLVGPTCDMKAVLDNGLIAWARGSWYLEETDSTEPGTGVPKYWRLGPKPNLNQVHDSYRRKALSVAKGKFDEVAKKCSSLKEGCDMEGVKPHIHPTMPKDVDDDGTFRLVVLGADFAGVPGSKALPEAEAFLRTHSSATDNRTYQNTMLVVTPSQSGLQQAEQQIADWLAWQEIESSKDFKDLDATQQAMVRKRRDEARKAAETAVKNAYELVLHLDNTGAVQLRKFTMGAQALFATLLQEKELRLFRDKIDAEAIMPVPGAPFKVWPSADPFVPVAGLYLAFARQPSLPKLLSPQTVVNTIAEAVQRGVLAVRYVRPSDGSEMWFWRSKIDIAEWAEHSEAWLPDQATLTSLSPRAVLAESLPGLWPDAPNGVELATLCSWFDGSHSFDEVTQPGYPPEPRPIPKVSVSCVHQAVAQAVKNSELWLVFGNDSVFGEEPTAIQLDAKAVILRPPASLTAIELLPGALPAAWSTDAEPKTTVAKLYAALKSEKGHPWPVNAFVNTVNEALGRGTFQRDGGSGNVVSMAVDGSVRLVLKSAVQPPPPPSPPLAGRKVSPRVSLSPGEFQDLNDEVATLTKHLAGCDVQFDIAISIKPAPGANLDEANKLLEKVKSGWKL